jgi:hypothetical protein
MSAVIDRQTWTGIKPPVIGSQAGFLLIVKAPSRLPIKEEEAMKSVIARGIIIAALAFAGSAAQAAQVQTLTRVAHVSHVSRTMHVAAHKRTFRIPPNYAQLLESLFSRARSLGYAGPFPNVWTMQASQGSSTSSDESYDNSSADTSATIDT